jgi:hypothetical protein
MNRWHYLDILIECTTILLKKLILLGAALSIILGYAFKMKSLIVIVKITVLKWITLKKDYKISKMERNVEKYLFEVRLHLGSGIQICDS